MNDEQMNRLERFLKGADPEIIKKTEEIHEQLRDKITRLFLEDAIMVSTGLVVIGKLDINPKDIVTALLAFINMEVQKGSLILKEVDNGKQQMS